MIVRPNVLIQRAPKAVRWNDGLAMFFHETKLIEMDFVISILFHMNEPESSFTD